MPLMIGAQGTQCKWELDMWLHAHGSQFLSLNANATDMTFFISNFFFT